MTEGIVKRVDKAGRVHYQARAEVGINPATGRRRQKKKHFDRLADAERWLAETRAAAHRGAWADPGRATVGEYVDRWYAAAVPNLGPRSRERYASTIRIHVMPTWQHARLSSVRPSDLRLWFQRLQHEGRVTRGGGGLSVDSLRYVRSVLHQAMALAVEDGAVVRNPVDVIRLPQARPREVHPLTAAQVRALVAAADGHRLQALFVLALTSGARAGELLATRWDDLDLPAGILSVRKSLQRVKGGGLVLGAPKTATSLRRIDLPALAVAALAAHQARQAEERAAAGSSWRDLGFVFCSPTGSPLDESNVYKRQWLPLLAAAGIPPMRLHDARHSHASLLLDQGESVKVVQERLGHADPRTTLHLYGHVMPGAHRRAAETLDAVLSTPEALAAEPSEAPSKGTKRARERR